MKGQSIRFVGIFSLLFIFSCSSEFLNVKVQSQENITSDPNLASELVIGVYSSLLQGDPFGNGDVHGFAFMAATNIMSDDADKGSFALDQASTTGQFDDFTVSPANQFCNTLWMGHYNGIAACNQALKAFKSATISAATLSELRAEVRFVRAYYYFSLVRMFGGVPLVMQVPLDVHDALTNPVYVTRADAAVVYDSIIQDLKYASKYLPLKSQLSSLNIGHATKGAAHAMLAKVYMYTNPANWNMVKAYTDSVINSAQYQLVTDYGMQFRQAGQNGLESIFEIQTGTYNNAPLRINNYCDSQGPRGVAGWNDLGWGFNDPSVALINSYESGDLRKNETIIFIDNSGTHKGTVLWDGFRVPSSDSVQNLYYNYKAYTSNTDPNGPHGSLETYITPSDKDRPKNVIILRYADVLLMSAEAAVNLGGDAATPLNLVRARAGLPPKPGTLANIKQERHVELAMEDDRFWDLVRWGDVAAAMQLAGKTNFQTGRNELLPIPTNQILLSNGKLTQNPGY